jgi:prophage regulatory protein
MGRNAVEDLERSARLPAAAAALEGSDAHPVLLRQNAAALRQRGARTTFAASLCSAGAPTAYPTKLILLSIEERWLKAEVLPQRRGGIMLANTASRILRLKIVLDHTGLSRSTLYRKIKCGTFPKQVRISERCIGWREADIERWLRNPMFCSRFNDGRDPLDLDWE